MLNEITGDKKYLDKIASVDPLFMEFDTHEGQAIDFANELIRFGMLKRAKEVLSAADVTPKTLNRRTKRNGVIATSTDWKTSRY